MLKHILTSLLLVAAMHAKAGLVSFDSNRPMTDLCQGEWCNMTGVVNITFDNIPKSVGPGLLRIHALGDFDGYDFHNDEHVNWDVENPFGPDFSYEDFYAWTFAGPAWGGNIISIRNDRASRPIEWVQEFVIPPQIMAKATKDNIFTLNFFFHEVDNYEPDLSFFNVRLTYRTVPEPGTLLLLSFGLVGLLRLARDGKPAVII